jgi:hypothetical protein
MTIQIPLGKSAHHYAAEFAAQQATVAKGKQVYLNTLSVYAVHSYLKWVQIDSQLEASQSWNPIMQSLLDIADLELPGWGRLECRPALPGAESCTIPWEILDERIGYMVVQIEESMTSATLLGFVPTVVEGELPLHQLQPLDRFFDHLETLSATVVSADPAWTKLGCWFQELQEAAQGVARTGWEIVSESLEPQPQLAYAFRSLKVKRRKLITLSTQPQPCTVELVLTLEDKSAGEIEIFVELFPAEGQPYLATGVALEVTDLASGQTIVSDCSGAEDISLPKAAESRHPISGQTGERFSVRVTSGEISQIEYFEV